MCHISAALSIYFYLFGYIMLSPPLTAWTCDTRETVSEIPCLKKEYTMRKIAILMGAVMILAGCNTVRGIGQDVQSVGRTVSDTAD